MANKAPNLRLASDTIPSVIRFLLLNVEPLFATGGAILLCTMPSKYVFTMSRNSIPRFDPSTNFIYTELAGGWLHFAFTEAVVLRLVENVGVWQLLSMGMLLSDVFYCHSCAQAVGGWAKWIVFSNWTVDDWIVAITTWPFVLSRVAIVLELGFDNRTQPPSRSE